MPQCVSQTHRRIVLVYYCRFDSACECLDDSVLRETLQLEAAAQHLCLLLRLRKSLSCKASHAAIKVDLAALGWLSVSQLTHSGELGHGRMIGCFKLLGNLERHVLVLVLQLLVLQAPDSIHINKLKLILI